MTAIDKENKNRPPGPIRTCLGCGRKKAKRELYRFAVNRAGCIIPDQSCRMEGRGAYTCHDSECISSFLKNKKRLARVFRKQGLDISKELHGTFRSIE